MNELKFKNYKKAYDYVVKNRYNTRKSVPKDKLFDNKQEFKKNKENDRLMNIALVFSLLNMIYLFLMTSKFNDDIFTIITMLIFVFAQTIISFLCSKEMGQFVIFKLSLSVLCLVSSISLIYLFSFFNISDELLKTLPLLMFMLPLIIPVYSIYKKTNIFFINREILKESDKLLLSFKKDIHLAKAIKDLEEMEKTLDSDIDFKDFLLNSKPEKEEKRVHNHLLSLFCYTDRSNKQRLISYLRLKNMKEEITNI